MKLLDKFFQNVKEYPERVVLADEFKDYTNRDLLHISGQVYAYLKNHQISSEDVVMINTSRDARIPLCFYGIMRAGACSLIVINDVPKDVFEFFVSENHPRLIITDALFDEILKMEPIDGYQEPSPHDAGVIIYTSSSSGTLKGAIHEYGDFDLYCKEQEIESWFDYKNENLGVPLALYDLASIRDMISSLFHSQYMYILPFCKTQNIDLLRDECVKHHINSTILPPGSPITIADMESIPGLIYLYVAFDVQENLNSSHLEFYNGYGMSESLLFLSYAKIEKCYDIMPVGQITASRPVVLRNNNDEPVSQGKIGEITFENPYFRGYVNNYELTQKVLKNGIFYSGDMAYIDETRMIYLVGRKDDMVYYDNRYWIPSYVESALKKLFPNQWFSCNAKLIADKPHMRVFYSGDYELSLDEIRQKLALTIDEYMLPTDLIHLDEIPTLRSGKLNRAYLRNQ